MSVYVDTLKETGCLRNKNWPYKKYCNMMADTAQELHEFAEKLGLKFAWFQSNSSYPHYDLTAGMRKLAVQFGAIEMRDMELIRHLKKPLKIT